MINVALSPARRSASIAGVVMSAIGLLERIPVSIPQVLFRGAMALVFWRSAQTKLANWDLTVQLFQSEYRVPILPPELAAYIATGVELTTPVLLVLGLGSRLGASAMLAITLVIQLFVYPQSYPDHLLWAGPLLYLILRGPGTLSIDHLLRRQFIPAK
jgi:putative oxidoreductase